MKKSPVIIVLVLLFHPSVWGQNLVPNPSFEEYSSCPDAPADIDKAIGWTQNGSSDYYNSCDPTNTFSVPLNAAGYQQAASGNGYAGIVTYYSLSPNYRELITNNLLSSLSIGTRYYVSFKTNLSLGSIADANCATDKIGAMFSTVQYSGFYEIITNNSPIYSNEIITDSLNWSTVFGSFVADSIYNYIILGNFFDDANTNVLNIYNTSYDQSYYFLDDICVSTDSLYTLNYNHAGLKKENISEFIDVSLDINENNFIIRNLTSERFSYELYNSVGQKLFAEENIPEKEYKINIESFSTGLFFIEIKSANFVLKRNLLKP